MWVCFCFVCVCIFLLFCFGFVVLLARKVHKSHFPKSHHNVV